MQEATGEEGMVVRAPDEIVARDQTRWWPGSDEMVVSDKTRWWPEIKRDGGQRSDEMVARDEMMARDKTRW